METGRILKILNEIYDDLSSIVEDLESEDLVNFANSLRNCLDELETLIHYLEREV